MLSIRIMDYLYLTDFFCFDLKGFIKEAIL